MTKAKVVVVGGGLAGLSATMQLAQLGVDVDVVSLTPVKRSHSCCAQGGINSVNNLTRQLGDTEWKHFDDTVYGGDFLQHQPPVHEMAQWAPKIIELMDRLGVTFNRTPEGFRDQRRFGGTLYSRTAFAGATTGQQLLYALDEQVRRWEEHGHVTKHEFWEYLGPVLDNAGECCGCVVQDLVSMEIRPLRADALVIASGGCGLIYGRSTMSMACTGSAASRTFQAGVHYANGEFIQVHPTAIPAADKLRLMSESARGEGGRVWVSRTPQDPRHPTKIPAAERYYFLEERYPKYGNLVPRDIATREIFNVCTKEGLSVEKDRMCVYLDVSHLPKEELDRKLGGILEIYEKFQGVDPREVPMKIFPAVHYSMGGLWVDYEKAADGRLVVGSARNQATNIGGLYAAGEVDYAYHGANRLGANSLLSCIYGGIVAGPAIATYVKGLEKSSFEMKSGIFDKAAQRERDRYTAILQMKGKENPYKLHQELAEVMLRDCTIERHNETLDKVIAKIDELEERSLDIGVTDTSDRANQGAQFVRHLKNMLVLARVIAQGARNRNESRGAHFKPEFKTRDDANWLRTTMALYEEGAGGKSAVSYVRELEYPLLGKTVRVTDEVDTSLVKPRARKYETAGAASGGEAGPKSQKSSVRVPSAT